jgi:hypothetical protein
MATVVLIPFTLALALGLAGRSYLRSTCQGGTELWQPRHLKRSLFFFGGAVAASCTALGMAVVEAVR